MQKFQIPEIHEPGELLVGWHNGFTEDEVALIVAQGELAEFQRGKVGTGSTGRFDGEMRETDIAWIPHTQDTRWLYERIAQLIAKINKDKFQFDLDYFQPLQYGKYQEGGHYDWHIDTSPEAAECRKLSVVVSLSDPADYEGGEFQANIGGHPDQAQTLKLQKGMLIAFPSYLPHRVLPVTKGERLSLVAWAVGPKFR